MVWLKFIVCVAVIFFAGKKIAWYGDIIAHRTGLGQAWIGVILLAIITSLPELFNGISAITIIGEPDLTIGNLVGANTFNLLNLALLDIGYRHGSVIALAGRTQRLTGWYSIVLMSVVALGIYLGHRFPIPALGWLGWYSPVIIILNILFMRRIFFAEQREKPPPEPFMSFPRLPLQRVYLYFVLSAAAIIGAGVWLASIGNDIAQATGWERNFVGSLFLAFTTTLPEITVSFSALRLGAVDMAVANLVGSNLFNMTIITLDDLLYVKGPVLSAVSETNIIPTLTAILMMALFIAGLRLKPKRYFRLSWCNVSLIAVFLAGAYLNFILS